MDSNRNTSAAYTPLVDEQEYAFSKPTPPPVYPMQDFPLNGTQPTPYPPQGYQQQPPQGYESYPQQGYPQQGYQQPQQGYAQGPTTIFVTGEPALHDATPFVPTSDSFGTQVGKLPTFMWRAISSPRVETFNELKMSASWSMVWFVLFVKTIIAMLFAIISFKIVESQNNINFGNTTYETMTFVVLWAIFAVPLSFFIVNGGFSAFAQCMAGSRPELTGHPTFLQYCFVTLCVGFPLSIIGGFLSLIPSAGGFFALAVWIYNLVLWVYSLKGVYHMTTGQAIGVILLFGAIVFVIGMILIFTVGFALMAAMGF